MPARSRRIVVLSALWSLVAVSSASAAPGDLDLTFHGDGKRTTSMPGWGGGSPTEVALQADGKIVVVGWARASSGDPDNAVFVLARYNRDGTLDRSFGGDGKVITRFKGKPAAAMGVAIQTNGKIVAVGSADGSFGLVRYRPNGTLDPSFGRDGRVRTDFTPWDDFAADLVIQDDGKIVAGGRAGFGGGRFALARYHANGTLDPTFGGKGKAIVNFSLHDDHANALALQADGKIVAAGSGGGSFGLVRFMPNGTLDNTFSGDGTLMTDFPENGQGPDAAFGVALQPDGRILAAGQGGLSSVLHPKFALARYETDGTLDATFDGDGRVTAGPVFARDVAVQTDGKVVTLGGGRMFFVTRFGDDGTLDATFGTGGTATTAFPPAKAGGGTALVIQPNGRILAAGRVGAFWRYGFGLARYMAE